MGVRDGTGRIGINVQTFDHRARIRVHLRDPVAAERGHEKVRTARSKNNGRGLREGVRSPWRMRRACLNT